MNNINPNMWGNSGWTFLHYITFAYPDHPTQNDKNMIKNFFDSVSEVLPCEKCRFNFKNHTVKYPLNDDALNSRFDLVNWLINIHNEANKSRGKAIMTYEQVIKQYLFTPKNNCLIVNNRLTVIIVSVALIIIFIVFLKFYSNDR